MDHTARLDLPFIMAGQALKHVTHNEALESLDALVQPIVQSTILANPPLDPLPGEAWIVPSTAGDAWAGHADEIAAFQSGAWRFFDPAEGWQVYDRQSGTLRLYSGSAWIAVAAIGDGLPQLGINASADPTNRLAVSSHASLFSHAGAGHQLKLNKASDADTASLLFQSNWSGRAEMGLMGDASWRLKISADGASWTDALSIDVSSAVLTSAGTILPNADNVLSLGTSGARWSQIWAANGVIQTSDERQKRDIAAADLGLDFIRALNPVRFRWVEGDTRTHYGLIAQQVAQVLATSPVSDFGGHVLADPTDPQSQQALRYDQFIAPLIAAIKELSARLEAVEAHSGA